VREVKIPDPVEVRTLRMRMDSATSRKWNEYSRSRKVSIPRQSRGLYDWAAQSGRWGR